MYVSLKELYSEAVHGKSVQPLPRQLVMLTEQTDILEPGKLYNWNSFNLENPSHMFYNTEGGMGRGEYSLACILWGVRTVQELKQIEEQKAKELNKKSFNIIQGTGSTFDVLGPNGERYEVKELEFSKDPDKKSSKTVRTGANGKQAAAIVTDTVNNFLQDILKAYSSMDDNSKAAVNDAILKSSVVQNTILGSKVQSKYWTEDKVRNWTLEAYINDIMSKSSVELSQKILLGDFVSLGNYKHRPALIFSLKQLVDVLNEISSTTASAGVNPSIKDLYDTMVKNYRINIDDEQEKEFFEKEAKLLDRSITQKQCRLFKKCTNQDTFKQILRSLNLQQGLDEIRVALRNVLRVTFPETGLFIVSPTMFTYIPRERLNEFIEANQISAGAPKIGLKVPIS